MLKDKNIVLGVTGGIAVYKACDLVSRLKKQGAGVRVVLTANAAKFVPPLTFETLSGNPVVTDTFEPRKSLEHISLAKWADAFVIAPASANCLAKLAGGIADTPVALAAKSHLRNGRPLVIAVSSNDALAQNAKNIGQLLAMRNIYFVPFAQDDPAGKPNSLVARFEWLPETVKYALEGRQIQPLLGGL